MGKLYTRPFSSLSSSKASFKSGWAAIPTSGIVSTVGRSSTFLLTYITYLPHEVNATSENLASMVTMDQSLQIWQLRRYSSTVGHQNDVLILSHLDTVAMRTTEHDPVCLFLLALSDGAEEFSRKASTWLYKEVETVLGRICPGGHDEWMALQKGPEAH